MALAMGQVRRWVMHEGLYVIHSNAAAVQRIEAPSFFFGPDLEVTGARDRVS
jgi:hypothetical protein